MGKAKRFVLSLDKETVIQTLIALLLVCILFQKKIPHVSSSESKLSATGSEQMMDRGTWRNYFNFSMLNHRTPVSGIPHTGN